MKLFIEKMISYGGWPISRGVQISFIDQKLTKYIFTEPKKSYTLAISDYIAHGGDNMDMLKFLPQKNTQLKIRDILIAYAKYQKTLIAKIEGRIIKE